MSLNNVFKIPVLYQVEEKIGISSRIQILIQVELTGKKKVEKEIVVVRRN